MRKTTRAAALIAGFGLSALLVGGGAAPGAAPAPPSAHCHVVDGTFTTCPDGSAEWSDVPAHFFAATNAYLYADQADLNADKGPRSDADTFELMYDECANRAPLGRDEYFLITFDTVEDDAGESELERYAIRVYNDGTLRFFENGHPVADDAGHFRSAKIEGQRADAGFGTSPQCATPHLIVEFEIPLTATGIELNGGYSPDPIFWGATPPKDPPVANDDEGDLEDKDEVTVPVVSNDTDSDGSIDPATVVIASNPEHGTATPNGDGTVTFKKNKDFKHDDKFTYTVKDNDGLSSNAATVDITKPCSKGVGKSIDEKSSPAAAGKKTKKGDDVDKDNLRHEDETKLGTDPCHFDTDDDGLPDSWEVSGVVGAGIDLNGDGSPEVQAAQVFNEKPNPLRHDVYVEIDDYDCDKGGCPPMDPMVHDFQPAALAQVKSMFAGLPVQNPDKSTGVSLHLQEDEHVIHNPNCLQPPFGSAPYFGTVDQRTNPNIITAKRMAVRYLISGHSTLFPSSRPCPTPHFWEIARNMFDPNFPLPDYDNTPFGSATVGGPDMVLSLSPVWICPSWKTVSTLLLRPFIPLPLQPFIPLNITACDRESVFDPGIFPTTVPTSSGNKRVPAPYARLLGSTELNGMIQLQARSLAHLLGHSLGLAGDGEVLNDPAKPGGTLPPDAYANAGGLRFAKSLFDISDGGDHITVSRTGGSGATSELDIFGNPIQDALGQDLDGDGVLEGVDNCIGIANPAPQADLDGDGYGDACDDDIDADAIPNAKDSFPNDTDNDGTPNATDADDDGDTVADATDNCSLFPNTDQRDVDHDGIGDTCDEDSDADGFFDVTERLTRSDPFDAASKPEFAGVGSSCTDGIDNDRDGGVDSSDQGCVDTDGDTLPNFLDSCPTTRDDGGFFDTDGDGKGDVCDNDIDGDGYGNSFEDALGSDKYDKESRPEIRGFSYKPGTDACSDGDDNDDDGFTDGDDLRCEADIGAIVDNGVVQLGINLQGQLNFLGDRPSSGTRTLYVGLRYMPTNAESTAPGCLCEGWGVADPATGVAGYANRAVDGVKNLVPVDFTSTKDSVESVVSVGTTFLVTHDYHPSPRTPNLYEVKVTIENISNHDISDVRYRRVMDWDVEPTAFSEFVTVVTIQGSERAKNVLFSSDDGFQSANPLGPRTKRLFAGDAVDSGPADHGALFDFGFGELKKGEKLTFNTYYGAAGSEADANAALAAVKAEVFSYGQPNTPEGPTLGKPNTFIFAFSAVGGEPVLPPDSDADGKLDELDNCPNTPNPGQVDTDLNGIGDACETPELKHTTAGFLQANFDGGTIVEPQSVLVREEPPLVDRVVRIVRFRLDEGLADDAEELTEDLVHSLVEAGLVKPENEDRFVADVLAHLDSTPPVVNVAFGAPDGANGWFVHSTVVGTVTATDPSKVEAITCTGATVGAITGLGTTSASAQLTVTGDGTHEVSCTAKDGADNVGAGPDSHPTATVKIDATAPVVTCSSDPDVLWPPNHKLVTITATVGVSGGPSGSGGFKLVGAKSSEPDNGLGDGDTEDDLQGWLLGTPDTVGQVRAERAGQGPGRTYTLTYRGEDGAGNSATCGATVQVPHDMGG